MNIKILSLLFTLKIDVQQIDKRVKNEWAIVDQEKL